MKKDWLQFLFGESQVQQELEEQGEEIVHLFEKADETEMEQMKFNKSSLTDALKSIGVSLGDGLSLDPDGYTLTSEDRDAYTQVITKLTDVDNLHKLAEAGWVAEKCGDQAMANEPAEFKVRFLAITDVDATSEDAPVHTEDSTKPDLEKVIKQAREFASTPLDRDDDDLNPVENDAKDEQGGKKTGVGDAKDGSDPEGRPKGSTSKTESVVESILEGAHKPGCTCGFCKNKGRFGKKKEDEKPADDTKDGENSTGITNAEDTDKEDQSESLSAQEVADKLLDEHFTGTGSMAPMEMGAPADGLETKGRGGHKLGRKFKMPGQWKQKTPITKKK